MKKTLLVLSALFFLIFGYFFLKNLQSESNVNQTLLAVLNGILVLMGILVAAIVLVSFAKKRKAKKFIYNSYSERRIL